MIKIPIDNVKKKDLFGKKIKIKIEFTLIFCFYELRTRKKFLLLVPAVIPANKDARRPSSPFQWPSLSLSIFGVLFSFRCLHPKNLHPLLCSPTPNKPTNP